MRTSHLAAAAALTLAVSAASVNAQNNWTVISTAGSPDPVHTFDLSNPGFATQIGTVATNFNRGADYFATDSFYYFVSTDALNNPGDRGLWTWVNNTNTQLATIDFSDGGDGDASFDAANNRLFVTVDDQDATTGDSLYVWDNLGGTPTFTEIGETGLTQLIGCGHRSRQWQPVWLRQQHGRALHPRHLDRRADSRRSQWRKPLVDRRHGLQPRRLDAPARGRR